jgi:hypothetical protein
MRRGAGEIAMSGRNSPSERPMPPARRAAGIARAESAVARDLRVRAAAFFARCRRLPPMAAEMCLRHGG